MTWHGNIPWGKKVSLDLSWLASQFPQLTDIEILGEGGQKLAYSCIHKSYGKCALKIIKPGEEMMLDRELEAVRRVGGYGYVPKIYEVGILNSQLGKSIWILEEYIDGKVLSEILKNTLLGKEAELRLASDLLHSATEAEKRKIVHRDIKPDNIKIDHNGKAWLLDYGIARILDMESKTKSDAVVGPHSPGYSAPEQFRYKKRAIDGRSDLFAIGVTLYEAAIGINPFLVDAQSRLEVLHRVENMRLPPLTLKWDPDRLFAGFVSTLIQKHPTQRPRTCSDAQAWLNEIIDKLGG